jgi:ABC-type glycerol-3-phosphate transport system substrate-binding protein
VIARFHLLTVVAVSAVAALAGCGSSSSSAAAPGSSAPIASDAPASSAPPAGGTGVDAAALCSFLSKKLPDLKVAGVDNNNKDAAFGQYGIALAGFLGDVITEDRDIYEKVDAAAAQTCPKVRDEVLAATGRQDLTLN